MFWGCLGALGAFVLRFSLTGTLTSAEALGVVGSVVVTILLIVLGGAWAYAIRSHTEFLAMYHGATFPVMFAALGHIS